MKVLLLSVVFLFSLRLASQAPIDSLTWDLSTDLMHFLPVGKIEMDIMGFQVPAGYNELLQKIKASIASHQEWYAEFIKKAAEPPGYHPNLGVTEEEWKSFHLMSQEMQMAKIDSGYLDITHTDTTIILKGSGNTLGFDGVKIDLVTRIISTGYGSWNFTQMVKSGPEQNITGAWDGYTWKYQEMDTTGLKNLKHVEGKDYNFSIGQLADSKRGIILFKAREFSEGQQYRMADLLVTYEIPRY